MLRNVAFIVLRVVELLVVVFVGTLMPSLGFAIVLALDPLHEALAPRPPAVGEVVEVGEAPAPDLREFYPAVAAGPGERLW